MKRRSKDLNDKERIATLDALYTAAGTVRGRNAMKLFLRDLLTESERIMLGRRILIARLTLAGKGELEIAKELRVGTDTIWRVKRWLRDQMPGYEDAIHKMEWEFEKRKQRAEIKYGPFSLRALKRKYPLHFLLFPPYN